jgi:hypothetical protein
MSDSTIPGFATVMTPLVTRDADQIAEGGFV